MSTADLIMRAATHNAPPERRVWAHAMQAEFETLECGKLGWAVGCLVAMVRWRASADSIYAALLAATVLGGLGELSHLIHNLVYSAGVTPIAFGRFLDTTGFYPNLLLQIVICAALSAYRPDRSFTTVLIVVAADFVSPFIVFPADRILLAYKLWRVHYLSAPIFVAIGAKVGWCVIGCQIGIAVNRLFHRKR